MNIYLASKRSSLHDIFMYVTPFYEQFPHLFCIFIRMRNAENEKRPTKSPASQRKNKSESNGWRTEAGGAGLSGGGSGDGAAGWLLPPPAEPEEHVVVVLPLDRLPGRRLLQVALRPRKNRRWLHFYNIVTIFPLNVADCEICT
jgi:hypothetical protein